MFTYAVIFLILLATIPALICIFEDCRAGFTLRP